MRYHLHIHWDGYNQKESAGENVKKSLVGMENGEPQWKRLQSVVAPQKLNTGHPKDYAIPLLDVCPKQMKIYPPKRLVRKIVSEWQQCGNNANACQLMNGHTKRGPPHNGI